MYLAYVQLSIEQVCNYLLIVSKEKHLTLFPLLASIILEF